MNKIDYRIVSEVAQRIVREFAEKGLFVHAGWAAFYEVSDMDKVGEDQRNDMKIAFFAGAEYLFHSVMSIMDEGEEPTDADLRRMDLIEDELSKFIEVFKENLRKMGKTP